MKYFIGLIIMILLVSNVSALQQGHLKLLAVKEGGNGYIGSMADIYLEIRPGDGRVFIETFPLSKMDTQISTRYAKEIACSYVNKDCSKYDFFYVIRSDAAIIGGPSAGGAIAVLTVLVLEDKYVNESIAMTGTINSGGLIGPVSGLQAKINAASSGNLGLVLIPAGEIIEKQEDNSTVNLSEFGKNKSITVIEVADLNDALYYFTGIKYKNESVDFEVNKEYLLIMESLAIKLCNRSEELRLQIDKSNNKEVMQLQEEAKNLSAKSKSAFEDKRFYSAASFCFGANVLYRNALLILNNETLKIIAEQEIEEIYDSIKMQEIKTISDLEAYIIVEDRLDEAKEFLLENETSNLRNFAKAIERVYSARSWSYFFRMGGPEFIFDNSSLREGCLAILSESEERYQYANLFFPGQFEGTRKVIDDANNDFENGDYALCLYKGSKAKAEVNVVLGFVGVQESQIDTLLDNKLIIVKRVIAEQQRKGMFPIMGYSYLEYADSLKKEDKYSAMLYAEYALELSNLDIYFKQKKSSSRIEIDSQVTGLLLVFISGILFGILITIVYTKLRKRL